MKIQFKEVGRNKKTWTAEVNELSESALLREIKKSGALMSRGVDVVLDDGDTSGLIIVGGWRTVGTFEILHDDSKEFALAE